MDEVVAPPGDQVLPLLLLDVRVTLLPTQKLVGPLAVMVGTAGVGFTVTVTGADAGEVQPETVDCTE